MLILLPFATEGNEDLVIIRDLLLSTKEMLEFEPMVILPLEARLKRYERHVSGYSAAQLVANARNTLLKAVETAVAEGERVSRLAPMERTQLLADLSTAGLTGDALRAKVTSYKLLWYRMASELERLEAGRPFTGFGSIRELFDLLKQLWSSLKSAIPGAEQIEELLGLLDQLLYLARGAAFAVRAS